jgi:hypothetical protein
MKLNIHNICKLQVEKEKRFLPLFQVKFLSRAPTYSIMTLFKCGRKETNTKQKSTSTLMDFLSHFQKNEGPKIARSLKIKWGAIKHYVNKFVGVYACFVAFNESKISQENTLAKTLELCKNCFGFIHCWLILKYVPSLWGFTRGQQDYHDPHETQRSCLIIKIL